MQFDAGSRLEVSTIVLAARLSARAMKRQAQRSSPPGIAVRSCRPRAPVESTAQAPLRHGNDERKNERKKNRRRNADRRKALLPWLRPRPRLHTGGAHLSAFHRGSGLGDRTPLPGFSSALPGMRPPSGFPLSLPVSVQRCFSRTGRNAGRADNPKPPGSGLQIRARAPHSPRAYGLPAAARPIGRGSDVYVTVTVTYVNKNETNYFRASCGAMPPFNRKDDTGCAAIDRKRTSRRFCPPYNCLRPIIGHRSADSDKIHNRLDVFEYLLFGFITFGCVCRQPSAAGRKQPFKGVAD
jgi:hypothetical protein